MFTDIKITRDRRQTKHETRDAVSLEMLNVQLVNIVLIVNTNNRTTIVAMNNNKSTLGLFNNNKPLQLAHLLA